MSGGKVWREAHVEIEMLKAPQPRSMFKKVHEWSIGSQKTLNTDGLGPLFQVWIWSCVAGAMDVAPCQE